MIRLTDEEIELELEEQRGQPCTDVCEGFFMGAKYARDAQLKKVVDELKERSKMEHERCDPDCAHRGVSIFFDMYDWRSLRKEAGDVASD